MAATIETLSQFAEAMRELQFCHVTICGPEYLGTGWQVTVRNGAWFAVGDMCPMLDEAFASACGKAKDFPKRKAFSDADLLRMLG